MNWPTFSMLTKHFGNQINRNARALEHRCSAHSFRIADYEFPQ